MILEEIVAISIIIIFLFCLLNILNGGVYEAFTTKKTCTIRDGRCYSVVGKYNNQLEASNKLAHLNAFSIKLMRHLREKYIYNTTDEEKRNTVKYLLSNYNPDNMIENAPVGSVNTSYVDNKGEVFAVCLREKKSGKNMFHDNKILEFVVMHEIAHLMTKEYDHSLNFWKNFKFLLTEAKIAGLHYPTNYKINPVNYCSLDVDYSPYYDDNLN